MQQAEIVTLARNAGLSQTDAVTAAAIAMAESGGDPRAHSQDSDDNSYGLWQINMLGAMGPARRKLYGLSSNDDLFDPATNAHVMALLSGKGANFRPWTTYTSGKYRKFLTGSGAQKSPLELGKVVVDAAGNRIGGGVVDAANSAAQAVDALQRVGTWIANPGNWVRVAYVAGGGALVVTALAKVIMSTDVGKVAVKAATKGMA